MYFCPNLAYLVGVLSRFYSNPGLAHIKLMKHVLQYISEIPELGLKFDGEVNISDNVVGYTDSDFAGSKPDQK